LVAGGFIGRMKFEFHCDNLLEACKIKSKIQYPG
jgi:hypothetical protein